MSATSVLVQLSGVEDEEPRIGAGLLDQRAQRPRRVGGKGVRIGLDLARDLALPGDPDRARDSRPAVLEVVLEVEAEVEKGLVTRDVASVEEGRVAQGDQGRDRLGAAELLERALYARRDLGHGGGREIPLVAEARRDRGWPCRRARRTPGRSRSSPRRCRSGCDRCSTCTPAGPAGSSSRSRPSPGRRRRSCCTGTAPQSLRRS